MAKIIVYTVKIRGAKGVPVGAKREADGFVLNEIFWFLICQPLFAKVSSINI